MTANINQHVTSRRASRRTFSERGSIDRATITITAGMMALVVVGMLGFFYLRQVIGTASQGGNIHTLETTLGQLKERQRQLELEGAQLRSLQTIEEYTQHLNLIAVDRVTYLAPDDNRVAFHGE